MTMRYQTDERGRSGRYVQAPEITMPHAPAAIGMPEPVYSELGDGRVQLMKPNGEGLGIFASRAIADRTVAFLTR